MTNELKSNSAKAVAKALNGLLADSFALYMKTKNFHWHVRGPNFRSNHLMFDEQATEILGTTDAIAERVRKIGQPTLTSIGSIASHQTIKDSNDPDLAATAMLAELRDDNVALVQSLRAAKEVADDAGDIASSAMIDEWTDSAERRAWFLRETLAD